MSRRLPAVTSRKVIKALERAGFVLDRTRGSHYHFIHPENPELTPCVPYHNRDLKLGTLRRIIEQANLTEEEFLDLL